MKRLLIILGLLISLAGFSQDLKYTNPRRMLNKLNIASAERLYLEDFGAVGDSLTDCSPALQAAHDALPDEGGEIIAATGVFRFNSKVNFTKPVHLMGTPVMSMIFSQPPAA